MLVLNYSRYNLSFSPYIENHDRKMITSIINILIKGNFQHLHYLTKILLLNNMQIYFRCNF